MYKLSYNSRMVLVSLFSILPGYRAIAGPSTAPDFTIQAAITKTGSLQLSVSPPPKHHLNREAPTWLRLSGSKDKLKPALVTEAGAEFSLPEAKPVQFEIELYLCDDANTFCERHNVQNAWDGENLKTAGKAAAAAAPTSTQGGLDTAAAEHVFIKNDPVKAFELAKKENKPILIDFYGIWCPPCNQLDEEVFSKTEFLNASKGWVKLKLDAYHAVY
ncbi:MAG: thioredoxin family protein, partial [Bdellovibrionota bacterium]